MKKIILTLIIISFISAGCILPVRKPDTGRLPLRAEMAYEDSYIRAVDDTISSAWSGQQDFLVKGKMVVIKQPMHSDGIVVWDGGYVPYIVTSPYYYPFYNIEEYEKHMKKETSKDEYILHYSPTNFDNIKLPYTPKLADPDY